MKIETIFVQGLNKEITFMIGKDKDDNFAIIDESDMTDLWIHANGHSSCHVVCKIPLGSNKKELKYIIKMGAILCKKYTNKLKSLQNVEFVYSDVKNVQKTNVIGCVTVSERKYITL